MFISQGYVKVSQPAHTQNRINSVPAITPQTQSEHVTSHFTPSHDFPSLTEWSLNTLLAYEWGHSLVRCNSCSGKESDMTATEQRGHSWPGFLLLVLIFHQKASSSNHLYFLKSILWTHTYIKKHKRLHIPLWYFWSLGRGAAAAKSHHSTLELPRELHAVRRCRLQLCFNSSKKPIHTR